MPRDFIRIRYDDRQKFPWTVFAGKRELAKCRTHKGVLHEIRQVMMILEDWEESKRQRK